MTLLYILAFIGLFIIVFLVGVLAYVYLNITEWRNE